MPLIHLDDRHRAALKLPGQSALRQALAGQQFATGKHLVDATIGDIGCGH
ncbi:MAG: hypothetical protein O2795_19105 [Acidobacteria bacterium]|nr:hypothetical protein [Acidobacteriota bacterium]